MRQVEQAIETAMTAVAGKRQIKGVLSGTAVNVRDTLCDVEREGAPTIYDVRLNAIDNDLQSYVTIVPAEKSNILVAVIEKLKTEAVVVRCSEVQKVLIKIGANTVVMNDDGFVFNDGDNEGVVKINELVKKLNAVEKDINNLKQAILTWVPTPNDGGATLKARVASWAASKIIETKKTDLEDSKIKH